MALPQLILVPGTLNDAELWRDQVADLADIARPVVADITRAETMSDMARAVLAIAEPRFALAGFSLGGIVAQEVMRMAGSRVTHLALLDTNMLPDDGNRASERQKLVAMARNAGRFHGFGEKIMEAYLAPDHARDPAMTGRVRAMTERLGPEVFIRQSLVDRPDNRPVLREIDCPALVLCGAVDRITPRALHEEMAALIPGAELTILPGCGHLTPIEDAAGVSAALRWLLGR